MSVFSGTTEITLAAGASVTIRAAFNGSLDSGGEYLGPVVAGAFPLRHRATLHTSNTRVEALATADGGLSSKVIYLYTVTNTNAFHLSFVVDYLFD